MYSSSYMLYYALAGVMTMIGAFVSNRLKSKFRQYSQVRLKGGQSGRDIAQDMLSFYGINDVKIVRGKGMLTDHYNPVTKTISLSPDVHDGHSVASAAVAAHECGHAVQHAEAYSALRMRSALVPMVQAASIAQGYGLMVALMMAGTMPSLLLIVIGAFAITFLFSLITLPVEFDASKRALVWLDESGATQGVEQEGAKDALWWAAMTYVSAALSSFVMLVYLIFQYMARSGGRR